MQEVGEGKAGQVGNVPSVPGLLPPFIPREQRDRAEKQTRQGMGHLCGIARMENVKTRTLKTEGCGTPSRPRARPIKNRPGQVFLVLRYR